MHLRTHARRVVALFAALALSLSLTACGGDDSSKSADNPAPGSTSSGQADAPEAATDSSSKLPAELDDFPLPAEYTVRTAGSQGGATTAILYNIPGHWEETKSFYETELPKAGWEIVGDRPFVGKDGTELDATKSDMEATVGISFIDDKTGLVINLVKP